MAASGTLLVPVGPGSKKAMLEGPSIGFKAGITTVQFADPCPCRKRIER